MSNPFMAAVVTACALSSTASAGTLTKDPDLGPYWNSVGPAGTYVYADSFVADASADVTDLGTWLLSSSGAGLGSTLAFEVWGSVGGNAANGPDASNVIASTGLLNLGGGTVNLDYYSAAPAVTGPLVAGQTYWFAITAIGGVGGGWQVGAHTQNSQQVDNGTFWYSNDAAGVYFGGMGLTPEMAFSVTTGVAGIDSDGDGVLEAEDCDDTDPTVGAESTWYADADADGYGDDSDEVAACFPPPTYVSVPGDCDDANAQISPAATEVCDAADVDENCDALADDASADDAGKTTWYADLDEDGFGDAADPGVLACDAPEGAVTDATDCDDGDATVSPDGIEIAYDGVDQDCVDGDLVDVDGDGYVHDGVPQGDDCDDDDASIHPGVAETADGVDQDCDDLVDEETAAYDDDEDGFSEDAGDCDDADGAVHPDAAEVADDGIDNDCDDATDEPEGGGDTDGGDTDGGDTDDATEGCGCDGSGSGLRAGLPMLLAILGLRRTRKARATA